MDSPREVVVVSALRTPFSRFGGVLRDFHSTDLGAMVIKEVLQRVALPGEKVDMVYYGMCIQSEAAIEYNVNARQALLKAGLPPETVSLTIDRACCSSLTCVQMGFRDVRYGEADVVLAVGAENMSNTPFVLHNVRWATGLAQPKVKDHLFPIGYTGHNSLAKDAGDVALEYGIEREEQDEWAVRSQKRWAEANEAGRFKDELMQVEIPQRKGEPIVFDRDEAPRPETTVEKLARLKPVYGSPTVTAGNAPGLDAGASAVLLMSREKAQELGLEPLATVLTVASAAREPRYIASAPADAIQKALGQAGMGLEDISLIEINEAFAAMPLVSSKILADQTYGGDAQKLAQLREKINVNGGAVAMGHPVGASGARILMTLAYELRRRGGGYGACGICGGLAQADAAIIRVDGT
jgi:acetyl-CoA C-acetyltransferase